MITIRPANDRGATLLAWLDSRHSFSFGEYFDPEHMRFRSLRVINDDRIAPSGGFGMHPHREMEIVTVVFSGALEHRDSLGHGEILRPGEVQRMSAGTGIRHSEFNPSATEPVHLLQIWIEPREAGLKPEYAQRAFPLEANRNRPTLVVSADGRDESLRIRQDADLFVIRLDAGRDLTQALRPGRHAWLQVVRGELVVNGLRIGRGDGLAASDEAQLDIRATSDAEVLLFDLA